MASKKNDPAKKGAPAKKATAKKKAAPEKKAEKKASSASTAKLKADLANQRTGLEKSTDASLNAARSSVGEGKKPLNSEQKKLQEKRREILSIRREARNPTKDPWKVAGRALSGKTVSETDAADAAAAAADMEAAAKQTEGATATYEPDYSKMDPKKRQLMEPREPGPTAPLEDIQADQARRKVDLARQGVKGAGRVVKKRRGTGKDSRTRARGTVSNPMTLNDVNSQFMDLLYDYEKPVYNDEGDIVGFGGHQDPPTMDAPATTMFHKTGDPENLIGTHQGILPNEFRTVTVAREEEKQKEAIGRTERLAGVSETLADFENLDKKVKEENAQGDVRTSNPAIPLAYKLSLDDQDAGEAFGVDEKVRKNNAGIAVAGTLRFLRNASRSGAFTPGGTTRQARALRNTRPSLDLENAQRDLELGKEDADERVSHLSSQLDDAAREIGARTGSDQLKDFADKLRTETIPKMPTTYDPIQSGVNVEGGMQASDLTDPGVAERMAIEATSPQWRDRSRTFVGPSPFKDYTHPSDFIRPGSIARAAAEHLNTALAKMKPEQAESLAADYIDYANVGPGISTGSPAMKLPADEKGNPIINPKTGSPLPPERVSLVPGQTPSGSTATGKASTFGLANLEPGAREQVDAVDQSGKGIAAVSRAMGGIRRNVGIPKRYGRGIPQDALIYTRRGGIQGGIERELMNTEIFGESPKAVAAQIRGEEPSAVASRSATKSAPGWFGDLQKNKKTSLTVDEMAKLPSGEPRTSTSEVMVGSQVSRVGLRAALGWANALTGGNLTPPTTEATHLATRPTTRWETRETVTENPPNLYGQVDKSTGNFPVRSFKMDSPEGRASAAASEAHKKAIKDRQDADLKSAYTRAGMAHLLPEHLRGGQFDGQ